MLKSSLAIIRSVKCIEAQLNHILGFTPQRGDAVEKPGPELARDSRGAPSAAWENIFGCHALYPFATRFQAP